MEEKKFSASLDTATKVVTVALIVLVTIIPAAILFVRQQGDPLGPLAVPLIIIVVFAIIFEYRVLDYSISPFEVIIRRSAGNVILKRDQIAGVELLASDQLRWSIRTFGVGGFFGYFGSFYNKRMGAMTWYLTRRDKLVLITTATGKKIVISPDDPEGFVAAAKLT